MRLRVRGIPTEQLDHFRRGGAEANGQPALVRVAEGVANPCRHCLGLIAERDRKVVAGHELTEVCREILSDATVAYVHIRSTYNCFQCRVGRG